MREPVEASGTSGSCPEAGGRQWKSVEDKEGVGRGSGGSGEVREVRRRSGRPWESAEEAGKAREVTVRYRLKGNPVDSSGLSPQESLRIHWSPVDSCGLKGTPQN